jgi:DUF1680 family protein
MDENEVGQMSGYRCGRIPGTAYRLEGYVADYVNGLCDHWLKVAPTANPAMLEMFRDCERQPYRDLVPWAGEFAGKYLTSAVQVLRLTGDAGLRSYLGRFVRALLAMQHADGYLGPWPQAYALSGQAPQYPEGGTWDAWGHYHIMLGLLLWYDEMADEAALAGVGRIGDLFCSRFLGEEHPRLVDTGMSEMNLAPVHALLMLNARTARPAYLALARQIIQEFAALDANGAPLAGNYLEAALVGTEFFAMPKPRWESLHPILALAELAEISGEERYSQAFQNIWWSIAKLDRHNTGGFSSGEQACGNPYHPGAIETCCTVAWIALSVEMLRITASSLVADELELATFNAVAGAHSRTGRWSTYNTPMDGVRRASTQDIAFQAREGAPDLNCCSVNAPRGFGMISDWAVMRDTDGIILNWYGPGEMTVALGPDVHVTLTQETSYPREGEIAVCVTPSRPATFTLKLRVPSWSRATQIHLNGESVQGVEPGSYVSVRRRWTEGDYLAISLDMTPHYWVGEQETLGTASIYRGPLLLAYDRCYNDMDPDDIPTMDARQLDFMAVDWSGWAAPFLLLARTAVDGRTVHLCDFGSAGEAGTPYRTWLPIRNVTSAPYSASNPMRSSWPDS